MQEFFQLKQYLLAANSIGIIAGDVSDDLLKVTENKLLDIFTDHVQILNKPTHISGSLTDHVYIKKTWMYEFSINVTVENIYFSNHDALRIVIEKLFIFILVYKIQYNQAIKKNLICFLGFFSNFVSFII